MLEAAGAGPTVVAAIMGLGAAGVAGGVIFMAWSLNLHQMQLAARSAETEGSRKDPGEAAEPADYVIPVPVMNGNGHSGPKAGNSGPKAANSGDQAIEGPDSVVIGEEARYRVRRSGTQQVVAWAVGGGAASQSSDPAHPDDLLVVADRPGSLMLSVRLREGLAERRETKAVTAVVNPATTVPAVASRMLLQDWPVITVAVLVVGFAAALTAVGSLPVGDFVALVAPLTAVLAVVAATRGNGGRPGR